ncbi:MAG: ribbon-helix-helix domain-containing protein [Xenococcaceae cyanobacterium]
MVRTSVTVPESLIEKFREYCKKNRRSVSAQITLLIERELQINNKEEIK